MTDQELLFLLEHDPEAGIHELMQMYGGAIYTICKNFLADCPESDIEETVADTYIHFWKYRDRFVPDENHSVKSYLYAIARNAARDRRRALNKHSVFSLEEISLDLPSVHNVESAYEKQRDEEILHECLKDMTEPDRSIFIYRYFYGFKIKQIAEIIKQPATPRAGQKVRPRKFLALVLAAALLMGFGVVASAAHSNDWDIALMEFMGIDNADTLQWSDGTVQIQASSVCSGTDYAQDSSGKIHPLKITATSSIGDKNAAYIRLDTNYTLPKNFDPERDYILPGNTAVNVYKKNPQNNPSITTCGTVFTSMEKEGKLVFLLYISDCPKINKSYVTLDFEDLYLYHGNADTDNSVPAEPELLYKGSWSLHWKYAYRSNVKRIRLLKPLQLEGIKCWLTQVEVSPLGIRLKAFVNPLHRVSGAVWMNIDKITYKDGTVLEIGGSSTAGNRNGIFLEGYCGTDVIKEVLNVDEIVSITVCGEEIRF